MREFTDLAAWRLSNELKREIYRLIGRPRVARDWEFCRQIRAAAAGVPRNIAEGFGRHSHREFALFVEIGHGSLLETRNHIHDGFDRGYFTAVERTTLLRLSKRALGAVCGLLHYLQSTPEPPNWR